MNYLKEMQRELLKFFKDEVGIKFYNYEMGDEKFPYALLQTLKVNDKFLMPEGKVINANIEILTDSKSNTEAIEIIELVKDKLSINQFNFENFKLITLKIQSYEFYKNKDGFWNALLKFSFSIVNVH